MTRRRPALLRIALCAAAALPLVAAAGMQVRRASASPIFLKRDRATLVFEQYQVDLGLIPAVREVGGRFSFRNMGTKTLRIRDLKPSCGCLQPQLAKREFAPGESGSFFVRTLTAQQNPGRREFTVKVVAEEIESVNGTPRDPAIQTASAATPEWARGTAIPDVELTFAATFPEKQVFVRPRALLFYQLSNQPTTQDVVVIDQRDKSFQLSSVSSSSPLVTAEIGATDIDEDGQRRHHLKVTAAGLVPPGRTRALLTIKTDDPTYRQLQVPLVIQGPESASSLASRPIIAEPPQIRLPATENEPGARQEVIVRGRRGEAVRVLGVDSTSPNIEARVVEGPSDSPESRIRVTLKGTPARGERAIVVIRTGDPRQPTIDLPVTIGAAIQQAGATHAGSSIERK